MDHTQSEEKFTQRDRRAAVFMVSLIAISGVAIAIGMYDVLTPALQFIGLVAAIIGLVTLNMWVNDGKNE